MHVLTNVKALFFCANSSWPDFCFVTLRTALTGLSNELFSLFPFCAARPCAIHNL